MRHTRLAGARFADQGDAPPVVHLQVDPTHRPAVAVISDAEIRHHQWGLGRGRKVRHRSRSSSIIKLAASAVKMIPSPGASSSHGATEKAL